MFRMFDWVRNTPLTLVKHTKTHTKRERERERERPRQRNLKYCDLKYSKAPWKL